MHDGTCVRDEWLLGMQHFLNVRLRTVSFQVASRNYPRINVPLPLSNSQYLIDGLMWSVRDNIVWVHDVWLSIQNHLHNCSQRHTQLEERLLQRHAHTITHKHKEDEEVLERECLYASHASVQDIYLAFCVVDAFLRHAGEESRTAKELAEKELPRLVADHMPIWRSTSDRYVCDAVEEYSLLFLNLLRSWTATKLLRPDTHRRMEEYVRHKLKTLRDSIDAAGKSSDGNNGENVRHTRVISTGLRMLLAGTGPPQTASSSHQTSPGPVVAAAVDTARMTMTNFVTAIFPPPRSEAGRQRCRHCGALLKSITAKNVHYRYHFYNRSYQTEEKIVRLMYPTLEDYISHEVDYGETGNFVKITDDMLDVLRFPEKRTVRARKRKEMEKPV